MHPRQIVMVALAMCLSACGPDLAITAVTTAKLQATQAQQAQAQMDQFKQNLGAAVKATEGVAANTDK